MAVRTKPKKSRLRKQSDAKHGDLASVFGIAPAATINVLDIRKGYGMSRARFHRFSGFSERALANWETKKVTPDKATVRKFLELLRLRQELSKVIRPEAIGEWMDTPNPAFNDLKPIEIVERGQADRIWRMVFELEAGMPA